MSNDKYNWTNLAADYDRLKSQRAVAKEYGTSKATVSQAMRRLGITTQPSGGVRRFDVENVVADYMRLGSPGLVADEYGCSPTYINALLSNAGVIRDRSHVRYNKICVVCENPFLANGGRKQTCDDCVLICAIIRCDKGVLCNGVCGSHDRQLRMYGLTIQSLNDILAQGCAVCSTFDDLHIDHDHACCPETPTRGDCNRGALCARHNHVCGKLNDDPAEADAIAVYLRANNVVPRPL